jgi:hypothetical protein
MNYYGFGQKVNFFVLAPVEAMAYEKRQLILVK